MNFFNKKEVFTVRNLSLMGILLAMAVIINFLSLYVTNTFRVISFGYLPGMVVSMLFGPLAGGVFAVASDTLGFFTNPHGGYFFGYAISSVVANTIYALFLYKQQLKLYKVIIAQTLITLIVNMGLGFLWISIMAGKASATFFTGARLINNLIQLPIHIAIIFFIVKFIKNSKFFSKESSSSSDMKK